MNGTIKHRLATCAEVDPEFVKIMIEGFYVDYLVTGERTVDRTFALYKNARERMVKGGFTVRKWNTNDSGLREMISTCESKKTTREVGRLEDKETYTKSKLEPYGGTKGEKVLGLAWDCEDDTLHFNFQHIADKAKGLEATKRNALNLLVSLFDLLGMVSPVIVGLRVLSQEICNSNSIGI